MCERTLGPEANAKTTPRSPRWKPIPEPIGRSAGNLRGRSGSAEMPVLRVSRWQSDGGAILGGVGMSQYVDKVVADGAGERHRHS